MQPGKQQSSAGPFSLTALPEWSCPAKVPDTFLTYAVRFSNARGPFPSNVGVEDSIRTLGMDRGDFGRFANTIGKESGVWYVALSGGGVFQGEREFSGSACQTL
jgi:hypothetical protein